MINLPIHAKTTQAQTPVILSDDSSNDDSSNDISSDVCTGGRNPTSKLGMRESMGGDFFSGRGYYHYVRGVEINLVNEWEV